MTRERARIVGADERLADEQRVEPGGGHRASASAAVRIALSATAIVAGGSCAREGGRAVQVLGERAEIAGVDPDDAGAERHRPLDLVGVVRLHEHPEPEPGGEARRGRCTWASSGSAARIRRIASAPMARAS